MNKEQLIALSRQIGIAAESLNEEYTRIDKEINKLERQTTKILQKRENNSKKLEIFEKKFQQGSHFDEQNIGNLMKLLGSTSKTYKQTLKDLNENDKMLRENMMKLMGLNKVKSILELERDSRRSDNKRLIDEIKNFHILENGTEKQKEKLFLQMISEESFENEQKNTKSKSSSKTNSYERLPESILAWSIKYHKENPSVNVKSNSNKISFDKLTRSSKTLAKSKQRQNSLAVDSQKTLVKNKSNSGSDIIKEYM